MHSAPLRLRNETKHLKEEIFYTCPFAFYFHKDLSPVSPSLAKYKLCAFSSFYFPGLFR